MITTQFEFMPKMLQGPAYNCSAIMPTGPAWSDRYGRKQIPFGIYSLVFGLVTEILYIPCMIGLRKELRSSCIKIMFCLSLLDIIAIFVNCIIFGYLLMKGAVFCSNPVTTLGVGIVGYFAWCTASSCCVLLAVNRLFEVLGLSKYFSARPISWFGDLSAFQGQRTNIYIGICCTYGVLMMLFTRPVIFNSALQSMFFSPFIPGHNLDEYVNWPHAIHNIVVTVNFILLYFLMCIVLVIKTRSLNFSGSKRRLINNFPIFAQAMLICCVNLVAASIYVFMNFIPVPPFVIIIGQTFWQLSHGSPPFIYLALNKSIRRTALEAVGLGSLLRTQQAQMFTTTKGQGSNISIQIESNF